MHSHQAVGDPALSSLMVIAVFDLMALPSTVSAHTVLMLVITIPAVVLAIVRSALVIAPISTMPIAPAVVASSAVATLAIAIAVIALAIILAIIIMSIVTILVLVIAAAGAVGSGDQRIGLPANSECPLSFCQQFESLVKGDSGLVHSDQHYHIIIVGRKAFDELQSEVAVREAPICNVC